MRTSHLDNALCLYYWKRAELGYSDPKAATCLTSSQKFATISISMQLVDPIESIDANELLNDVTIEIFE